MVKRVAQIGDVLSLHGHSTLATLSRQITLYREALLAAGKSYPPKHVSLGKEVYIAKDKESALREPLRYIGAKYAAYASLGAGPHVTRGRELPKTYRVPARGPLHHWRAE